MRTTRNGKTIFGYGGDWGPADVNSDNNFLNNGLVNPDRVPHPHCEEVKWWYAPIALEKLRYDSISGVLTLRATNRNYFKPFDQLKLSYILAKNGIDSINGTLLQAVNLAPGESKVLTLNVWQGQNTRQSQLGSAMVSSKNHPVYDVRIMTFENPDAAWPLLTTHFRLSKRVYDLNFSDPHPVRNWGWQLSNTRYATPGLEIDLKTGHFIFKGDTVGPMPAFWRAMTDNDFGTWLHQKWGNWMPKQKTGRFETYTWSSQLLQSKVLKNPFAEKQPPLHTFTWVHTAFNGHVHVRQTVSQLAERTFSLELEYTLSDSMPPAFRLGTDWAFPAVAFPMQSWYGRGPFETYADRKTAGYVGLFTDSVRRAYHPYIRPQESGNRTDVDFFAVHPVGQPGVQFYAINEPMSCSALPYSLRQLWPENQKRQYNSAELVPDTYIHLHIDHKQAGVAGVDSWSTPPLEPYRIMPGKYKYQYVVKFE